MNEDDNMKYIGKKRNYNKKENGLKIIKNDLINENNLYNNIIYTKNNKKIKKELTRKKKITIYLENNIYKFDVIEDISIKNLKKLIYCACGINKSERIQLFNNNKEYNSHPNLKLSFYFPIQESINFEVIKKQLNKEILINQKEKEENENFSDFENIEINEKCKLHFNKDTDYFCYDCNKGICFQCFISGIHKRHKFKKNQKNNLLNLNNSINSIDELFNSLNPEAYDEKYLNDVKKKLNGEIFPSLSRIIKGIECKTFQIFEEFFNLEKDNLDKFKNICSLTKILENKKLNIDDALTNLDIPELKNQDIFSKIKQYNKDFLLFNEEIKIIGGSIKTIYSEIYEFLDKYLKNDIFEIIIEKIRVNLKICDNKKELLINLINDIKNMKKINNSIKINKELIENKNKILHLDNKNTKFKKIFIDEDHYKIIN